MYLVEYPDKLLLLDGACRADIPHLKGFIETELMRDTYDLHTVVVTHMHPTNPQGSAWLRKLTNCNLVAANRDKDWYHGIDGILITFDRSGIGTMDESIGQAQSKSIAKPFKESWSRITSCRMVIAFLALMIEVGSRNAWPHRRWDIFPSIAHHTVSPMWRT